jgi:hypothetical protein
VFTFIIKKNDSNWDIIAAPYSIPGSKTVTTLLQLAPNLKYSNYANI